MELTDIMALVKAGYTKDEIAQMESPITQNANPEPVQMAIDIPAQPTEPTPAPAQAVPPVAVPVAQPAPAPAPVQQPVQTPVENQPTMADIMQGIAKLTSAVQANAIAQSVLPNTQNGLPKPEDIMAEIIRPTYGGKKDVP